MGMMQALFENNIRPGILSGTSAGSIAAAFIADGKEPYQVMELFASQTFTGLAKIHPNREGLITMDKFGDFLQTNLSARRIEDLKIPTVITATDFDGGQSVHFRSGDLVKCLTASCCIPVLFTPVSIGKKMYVDGGVFMNLPVSPIRQECDTVIALNVVKLASKEYHHNIGGIAMRAFGLMFAANSLPELKQADVVISPDGLEKFANYELDKTEEIFSIGYFAALRVLEEMDEASINQLKLNDPRHGRKE